MSNILFVATSSWAGMGPYASEIINAFCPKDKVKYFLVEDERHYFSKNIAEEMRNNGIIIYRKNSNINKLCDLIYPSKKISRLLFKYCDENEVDTIHFMTSEVPYGKIITDLSKKYKVFFTVHDLHPHEANKAFYKMLRQKLMYKKLDKIRKSINNLVTNSNTQEKELKAMFPHKNIYYFDFPSLVNSTIITGQSSPLELARKNNYVLYFGRIEKYKGVDLAYRVFTESTALKNVTLVIAGSGDIYFPRNLNKEDNIIFINRYINDDEVAYLFKNALVTIYPYLSATQSGVLSLSCYFGKPIIASDIPFFMMVSELEFGRNFKKGNVENMQEKILDLLKDNLNLISARERKYYDSHYSKNCLREKLLSIYNL